MNKVNKSDAIAEASTSEEKIIVVTHEKTKQIMLICDVCGYANPEHTAICKMCSNYLEGIR